MLGSNVDVTPNAGVAGFALLEFLVAFAILTMFITSMLIGTAIALRGDDKAAFNIRATAAAQSKLASASAAALRPGTTTGSTADKLTWRTTVRPHGVVQLAPDRLLKGYWIEVAISDPSRRDLRSISLTGFEIRAEAKP